MYISYYAYVLTLMAIELNTEEHSPVARDAACVERQSEIEVV